MSPTVFRKDGYRFYFFSREESRMHVHVQSQHGEAKFWLEPMVELAQHTGISQREINAALKLVKDNEQEIRIEINAALKLVKDNEQEIRIAWNRHFPS